MLGTQSRKGHTEGGRQDTMVFQDSNWQTSGAHHTRYHSGWEKASVDHWCGNTRRQQNSAERGRKDYEIPRSQDRIGATLDKESNSSAGGDRNPGSYSKRPRKTYENPGTWQDIIKPTSKGSSAIGTAHILRKYL